MLAMTPFVLLLDRHRRLWQHFVNNIWAKVSTSLFFPVKVDGREHLPRPDEPAVYVANHQSFMDIYSLFHLNRAFKFISKTSIFFFPIVGWSMFLTGHIKLNRTDRRSMMNCLLESQRLLKLGASVLFFPEGTRSTSGRLASFKKGAFSVAAKAQVPVVPITIVGTGKMMPNKQEYKLFPGGHETRNLFQVEFRGHRVRLALAAALGYAGLIYSTWLIKEEIGSAEKRFMVDFKELLQGTTVDFQCG
ncbi:hypothetical protein WJX74_010425 [Apatococcus lobatus]|uniref:1-acyl-sn-glycerol-3-phosphate acyltransferase n=1 Tax=Apatococcus lobatus TaxID=904363 RepID=A0AAW1QCL6_9CHLO